MFVQLTQQYRDRSYEIRLRCSVVLEDQQDTSAFGGLTVEYPVSA